MSYSKPKQDYFHQGRRIAISRDGAIGYAWAMIHNGLGRITLQDGEGQDVLTVWQTGEGYTRWKRRVSDTYWTSGSSVSERAQYLSPEWTELDGWKV